MNFQKMKTLWDVPDSMGGSIAGGAVEDTSSGLITLAIMVRKKTKIQKDKKPKKTKTQKDKNPKIQKDNKAVDL